MDRNRLGLLVVILLSNSIHFSQALLDEISILSKLLPPIPTFSEIALECGIVAEEHEVTTEDGYVLKIFHLDSGNPNKTILLVPGVLESTDSFITRRKTSLACTLVANGYDVWAGNFRGTRYSRKHEKLNPDTDKKFWDFSFHEIGYYDLPTIIDFVIDKTCQKKIRAVGYSEGNTIFYVLGATRPEYNDKIHVLAALSPMAYLQNTKGILPPVIEAAPAIDILLQLIGYEEILGFDSNLKTIIRTICSIPGLGYELCIKGFFFNLAGPDPEQIGPDFTTTLIDYCIAGTSRKTLIHYSQIGNNKKFAQYDYGAAINLAKYTSSSPPEYDLNEVKMDVAMFVGANDYICTKEDVKLLEQKLPNVVELKAVDYSQWNYLDQVIGRDMDKYLFPSIIELLSLYD